jgi:hypothetical protein
MKATLAFGFAHATCGSPPFSEFLIFELRFAIKNCSPCAKAIANRKSQIANRKSAIGNQK